MNTYRISPWQWLWSSLRRESHKQYTIDRAAFTPPDVYDFPPDCFGYDPRNHVGRHA